MCALGEVCSVRLTHKEHVRNLHLFKHTREVPLPEKRHQEHQQLVADCRAESNIFSEFPEAIEHTSTLPSCETYTNHIKHI